MLYPLSYGRVKTGIASVARLYRLAPRRRGERSGALCGVCGATDLPRRTSKRRTDSWSPVSEACRYVLVCERFGRRGLRSSPCSYSSRKLTVSCRSKP